MKCTKCGYENNDNAKFCNDCGEKLYEDKEKQVHIDNAPIKEEKSINNKAKPSNLSKRIKIMIGFIIPFVFIIIVGLIYANTLKPQEVFEQFSSNSGTALEQYDKLSDKNKDVVNASIKNRLDKAYDDNTDNATMQQTIDMYKDISNMKDYLQEMRDKSYFRVIYNKNEDSINKKGGLEKMGRFELESLMKEYEEIKPTSDFYSNSLEKIELIKKELPRADKEYIKDSKEKYGVNLTQTYFEPGDTIKKEIETQTIKKEPQIGMTRDEAIDSTWGKPSDINKTTTKYGTHEQWVYGGNRYLYFEGNKLTTIQN